MTTAPMPAPTHLARAGAGGRPARKQAAPARQRWSTGVLIVGTVLSLGSVFGPDWVLRMGVVIALVSATVSCGLAWRELYLTKRKHAQDLLAVGRRHTEDLRTERRHNADVLDTVSGRAQRWRREVDRQQTQIADLRVESTALRGDLSAARRQLVRADQTISGLREAVRDRDVELSLLRPTPAVHAEGVGVATAGAEVHTLPRRVYSGREDHVVEAGTLGHTVVDLPVEEPAMPNFEADRRPA